MPVLFSERKFLSEVIADIDTYGDSNKLDVHYATVEFGGAAVQPIGTPVVWVDGNSRFEVYTAEAQITAAKTAASSPLVGDAVCGILAGDKFALGNNKEDTTTATQYVMALVRGERAVIEAGVDFGAISDANKDAFKAEMLDANISMIGSVTEVTPSHLNV